MANLGSEISRALKWKNKNDQLFWSALKRGDKLWFLTIEAQRNQPNRLREIFRAKECWYDFILGDNLYGSTNKSTMKYFDAFANV